MKLIIAGTRTINPSLALIEQLTRHYWLLPSAVVSGGADGVDTAGAAWATSKGIPLHRFLPDWKTHGSAGGPMRNREMAEFADALLLLWDGESRGSKSMRTEMLKLRKPVYEFITRKVTADDS